MDKTIKVRIVEAELPELVHGFCIAPRGDDDKYVVALNDQDSPDRRAATFLHEMLHIYHNDHRSTRSASEIELLRDEEMRRILELLKAEHEAGV